MTGQPEQVVIDWRHLPSGSEATSLWDCLHDGALVHLASDLMERTVALRFDVDYVREFNRLPAGITFHFLLSGVRSVRSLRYAIWPGPCEVRAGMSRDEESRIISEYQAKWREETEDWSRLESAISVDEAPDVLDADLVSGHDETALRLELLMPDDDYREVFIRAESLEISTSDGRRLTIGEYLALGEAYWTAFEARADAGADSER